jgi:hypothetical protein
MSVITAVKTALRIAPQPVINVDVGMAIEHKDGWIGVVIERNVTRQHLFDGNRDGENPQHYVMGIYDELPRYNERTGKLEFSTYVDYVNPEDVVNAKWLDDGLMELYGFNQALAARCCATTARRIAAYKRGEQYDVSNDTDIHPAEVK